MREIPVLLYHNIGGYPESAMAEIRRHFVRDIRFCAFKEGVPEKYLRRFFEKLGVRGIMAQSPTNQPANIFGVGRTQIDDDDNIFVTKISNTYQFFKDRRSWQYIRKYKIDRIAHALSNRINRIKATAPNRAS